MDTVSKEQRSEIMRRVKGKDTNLERVFRRMIWKIGLRYRKNCKTYFGKPDLVFKKHRLVVFIDSCFWHGCSSHLRMPASNQEYWTKKIQRNKQRDELVDEYYKRELWKSLRIWEHDLINEKIRTEQAERVKKACYNEHE